MSMKSQFRSLLGPPIFTFLQIYVNLLSSRVFFLDPSFFHLPPLLRVSSYRLTSNPIPSSLEVSVLVACSTESDLSRPPPLDTGLDRSTNKNISSV